MTPASPQLRVLKYREDGEWVAHLLEMDLVGTGETPEEAEADLVGALEAQLTYCIQNKIDPFFPAAAELFGIWDQVQREELAGLVQGDRPVSSDSRRASIVSPPSRESGNVDGWFTQPSFG